jgi:16S rRNA (cytosine1402-N4)-methyltransferase
MTYHKPVLLEACINGLAIKKDGIYIDATFGGGGHSKPILKLLSAKGHLYGFDQDQDAEANVLNHECFTFVPSNFRFLKRYLRYYGVTKVDGILADLGVSSHQFDVASRGFSFRLDADLDMRMNQDAKLDAKEILNTYNEAQLQKMFSDYGEVRNARTLASVIANQRRQKSLQTISDLNGILERTWKGHRNKYFAQVYQAIRIEVNDELGALRDLLEDALGLLKARGRMVVMSYHSAEDRLVKNLFKCGNVRGEQIKDDYGNIDRPFELVNRKVIVPDEDEILLNSRARSAKLRIAEKK